MSHLEAEYSATAKQLQGADRRDLEITIEFTRKTLTEWMYRARQFGDKKLVIRPILGRHTPPRVDKHDWWSGGITWQALEEVTKDEPRAHWQSGWREWLFGPQLTIDLENL